MSSTSPLLLLDDERKAQLDLLNQIEESGKASRGAELNYRSVLAAVEICNAALGFLSTGINTKSITAAASQCSLCSSSVRFSHLVVPLGHLQLDVDTVRTTVDSLLWLYTECAKTKVRGAVRRSSQRLVQISIEALGESLKLLGYGATIRQSFIDGYQSIASQLQKTLTTDLTISLPHYKNLEWRFDVQVSEPVSPRSFLPIT